MPMELLFQRQVLEKLMDHTKRQIEENLELVALDGNCPDEKLL
jgi:hypothetical protein